jgi:A/G-specific adenine glycosylase
LLPAAAVRYNVRMSSHPADKLLHWYQKHGRDLPWRCTSDPYAILVSEFMLQQTRVETVIAYYERWMKRFPDFEALAAADQDEVLGEWEGLGYYRRAQNLHRTATIVHERYGGHLPADPKQLRELPGVGEYTAAAIRAFVCGRDEITLDGNLKRVLARYFGLSIDTFSISGKRILEQKGLELLPRGKASAFNQALMDLGSGICLPGTPVCSQCPLRDGCRAFSEGTQDSIPLRKPVKVVPHYHVSAGVLVRGGRVLLARRPEGKLLAGLWEFPGGKQESGENLQACLQRELGEELGVRVDVGAQLGEYRHAYTHYRVTVTAFHCGLQEGEPQALEHSDLAWAQPQELADYPMGKVDRRISADVLASFGEE